MSEIHKTPQAFYRLFNQAFVEANIEDLSAFFHPDFQGIEGDLNYGIDHIIRRAQHAKKRYGVYFFDLVNCHALSDNAHILLLYFYGHDILFDKPSERHIVMYHEFEANQILKQVILSHPSYDDDLDTPSDHLTIESAQRKKLDKILTLANDKRYALSARELHCLYLYLIGKSYKAIAERLCISNKTVDSHLNTIKQKCRLDTLKDLNQVFKLV